MYVVVAYKNDEWDGYVSYDLQHVIEEGLDPDLHEDFLYKTEEDAILIAEYSKYKKIRNGEHENRDWQFRYRKADELERTEKYYT